MSASTLPRVQYGHRYCWAEHPTRRLRCTEPKGHGGRHWHPYTRTTW
ncbi:hypothetical protein ACFU7X_29465 [Streptomyces chartreusis]